MLILNILKEIIKWITFRNGWKIVLIAFLIAILDTITWSLYTRDVKVETSFELLYLLIGIFYTVLYVGTKKTKLLEEEIRWIIWRFYSKKPYQVYLCIILFISSPMFNLYLNLIILIIIVAFLIKKYLSSETRRTRFFELILIEKLMYRCIPIAIMIGWFKISLKMLVALTTVIEIIEIISYDIYETVVISLIFSLITYAYISLYCSNFQKKFFVQYLYIILGAFIPMCLNCEQIQSGYAWCRNCGKKYSVENLSKWTSGHEIIDEIIKDTQLKAKYEIDYVEWIPYDEFENVKQIGKGGFGSVYSAVWKSDPLSMLLGKPARISRLNVAMKSLGYSPNITQEFLRELKAHIRCATSFESCVDVLNVLRCYGLSQDPITKTYMLVMMLGENGDLLHYLQKKFSTLKWKDKLLLLNDIATGLKVIHEAGLVHHDLHTGNIIIGQGDIAYLSDLGLSCPIDEKSSDSDIYGVLAFVAPEVLRGYAYTAESDVYSFGMIMWVLTSGKNPFSDSEYNIYLALDICRGKRPPIVEGTPKCYKDLMERCWDTNPSKRPLADELERTFGRWYLGEFEDLFIQADIQIVVQVDEGERGSKRFSTFIKSINQAEETELLTQLLTEPIIASSQEIYRNSRDSSESIYVKTKE